ncbi:MAG: hypothetical protein AB7O59_04000 [Pirellulales bacterium]
MELREALVQIAEIRQQMAKGDVFRGYRSAPVALSGVVALLAALAQPFVISDPAHHPAIYLAIWIGAAAVSIAALALEMTWRLNLVRDRTHFVVARLAVEQFLPSVMAGALVTSAIARFLPQYIALLPGLWQLFFGLGIFASARLLPKLIFLVGAFYFACGVGVLILAGSGSSLSPWCMGLPFGVGQLAAAAILYWTLERRG